MCPIASLAVSVFIYLYINVFLTVAPAAHFKLIVRQLACGAFIQFSSYMYASRYAYVVYFIYIRINRYICHIYLYCTFAVETNSPATAANVESPRGVTVKNNPPEIEGKT